MIAVTELSVRCFQESPAVMASGMNKQAPGLVAGSQIDAVIYLATDVVEMACSDVVFNQRIILRYGTEPCFCVLPAKHQ